MANLHNPKIMKWQASSKNEVYPRHSLAGLLFAGSVDVDHQWFGGRVVLRSGEKSPCKFRASLGMLYTSHDVSLSYVVVRGPVSVAALPGFAICEVCFTFSFKTTLK
ncbi:hypothetical protein SR86_11425 [Enterobacter hormaechei subsp. xiangfangensis]|nr:hypothetical protein SS01_16670 [Enterobacter hormaechei subsp. xiangfangensis]KJO89200.1 hypothetical protein SR86_11425 [Enterobacter hormaechei subsp. xiangfangensis]KJP02601.1 hypothetical protein SR95_12345 [Enterobacter hormaechei subsp. xiangfangensis]